MRKNIILIDDVLVDYFDLDPTDIGRCYDYIKSEFVAKEIDSQISKEDERIGTLITIINLTLKIASKSVRFHWKEDKWDKTETGFIRLIKYNEADTEEDYLRCLNLLTNMIYYRDQNYKED